MNEQRTPSAKFEEQKVRTQTVLSWLQESLGERAANDWLWSCTPFPCDLPSDEQLDEGVRIAAGEESLGDAFARVEAYMQKACEEWRAEQRT